MITFLSIAAAAALSAGSHPTHVPLTAKEAAAIGLNAENDGTMFRVTDIFQKTGNEKIGVANSLTIPAQELRPAMNETFLQETAGGRWCTSGSTSSFADVSVQLPDDAVMGAMRIWGFNTTANQGLSTTLIARCTPNNVAGDVFTSVIASITQSGNVGNFSQVTAIGINNVIDNDACSYTIRTRFSAENSGIACGGSGLRLQKIRIDFEE